jgi:hypothetical protein
MIQVHGKYSAGHHIFSEENDALQIPNDPLHAFKATADPDTIYLHQAMKQVIGPTFDLPCRKRWKSE